MESNSDPGLSPILNQSSSPAPPTVVRVLSKRLRGVLCERFPAACWGSHSGNTPGAPEEGEASSQAAPSQGPHMPCIVQPLLPLWPCLRLIFWPSLFYYLEPANSNLPQVFPYVLPSVWHTPASHASHPSGLSFSVNILRGALPDPTQRRGCLSRLIK